MGAKARSRKAHSVAQVMTAGSAATSPTHGTSFSVSPTHAKISRQRNTETGKQTQNHHHHHHHHKPKHEASAWSPQQSPTHQQQRGSVHHHHHQKSSSSRRQAEHHHNTRSGNNNNTHTSSRRVAADKKHEEEWPMCLTKHGNARARQHRWVVRALTYGGAALTLSHASGTDWRDLVARWTTTTAAALSNLATGFSATSSSSNDAWRRFGTSDDDDDDDDGLARVLFGDGGTGSLFSSGDDRDRFFATGAAFSPSDDDTTRGRQGFFTTTTTTTTTGKKKRPDESHLEEAERLAAREAAAFAALEEIAAARGAGRVAESPRSRARNAEFLLRFGRYEEALRVAQEALEEDPNRCELHYWKGRALLALPSRRCAGGSCRQHAAAAFAECAKFGGRKASEARVYLVEATANLRGIDGTAPERVAALFDEYADTFERHLVDDLAYDAPSVIALAVKRLADAHGLALNRTLDVGCGTGLVAVELNRRFNGLDLNGDDDDASEDGDASESDSDSDARRRPFGGGPRQGRRLSISGVDLSPKMVDRARRRGVYDEVEVCDARRLSSCARKRTSVDPRNDDDDRGGGGGLTEPVFFDLIVLADVLVYLDDVDAERVLSEAAKLEPTLLALTVERPDRETDKILADHKADDWRCILGSTGRYAHNIDWLVHSLLYRQLGYDLKWIGELCDEPDCQYPPLRYERGVAVRGAVAVFEKQQRFDSASGSTNKGRRRSP